MTLEPADPTVSAAEAGLHYVDDSRPGIVVFVRRLDGDGLTDEEQCALKLLEADLPPRTAAAA
jgi:hypothetical protein